MDKAKFVLTFAVAVAIIMGGYFLANKNQDDGVVAEKQTTGNKLGMDDPLQTNDAGTGDDPAKGTGGTYTPTDTKGNVTKMIAQSMFLKMKQLDESGTNPFGELNSKDPKTRALVEESINNVPETIFETTINTKDIKVTQDNSRSAKMRYIEGIDRITKARFAGAAGEKFKLASAQELTDNLDKDCFGDGSSDKNGVMSKAYEELFNDYKGLTVPSSWIAIHKAILGHFKELSDIYGAFGTCKEDPIRAYVGIDRLPEVYARTGDIQKMLNAKATELGLK